MYHITKYWTFTEIYRLSQMAGYRYPNLTIIDKSELHSKDPIVFDNAVIAKLPLSVAGEVGHQSLRDAIQQQFQVDIQVENISVPTTL
jgi:hypothetical protein